MNILFMVLFSVFLFVLLPGCNVASVDRNAVRVDLEFSEPESFPFMKFHMMSKYYEDGRWTGVPVGGDTSGAKIEELQKQGYKKEYQVYARLYLYTRNAAARQWEPITLYDVFYSIYTGVPWPVKKEFYYPDEGCLPGAEDDAPYHSITEYKVILDFAGRSTVPVKIVAVPSDGSAEARYWVTDIKRADLGKWSENPISIGLVYWAVSMPDAKIVLPPWNKWQVEPNPPPRLADGKSDIADK